MESNRAIAEPLVKKDEAQKVSRPVEKDGVDVLVRDGWFLGAGRHAEGSQEDRDDGRQLAHVLLLPLDEAEHDAVALAHAVRVLRPDVQLDDLLPAPAAQPAAEEALNLEP